MYDTIKKSSSKALARTISAKCLTFLKPFLKQLDRTLDLRLVRTLADSVTAIVRHRQPLTALLLSELGSYICDPQHAPAGTKVWPTSYTAPTGKLPPLLTICFKPHSSESPPNCLKQSAAICYASWMAASSKNQKAVRGKDWLQLSPARPVELPVRDLKWDLVTIGGHPPDRSWCRD